MTNPDRQRWCDAFFSSPNEVDRSQDQVAISWVERLLAGDSSFVLPIQLTKDGQARRGIVGVGLDSTAARILQEEVWAFIGATYARRADWLPRDWTTIRSLEAIGSLPPADRFPSDARAFRVELDPATTGDANAQLIRLATLRGRAPVATRDRPRPLAYFVRELRAALRAGEIAAARDAQRAIGDYGLVSGLNLLGIEVLCLAAEERWEDLLRLPEIPDMARIGLPRDVVGAALHALYHAHVEHLLASEPAALVEGFSNALAGGGLGGFFRNPWWATTHEQQFVWMLFLAGQDRPDALLARRLSEALDDHGPLAALAAEVLAAIDAATRPPRTTEGRASAASQLIVDGHYASALELLEGITDEQDGRVARLVVLAAAGLRDPSNAQDALRRIDALSPEAQSEIQKDLMITTLINHTLRPLLSPGGESYDGWVAWIEGLAAGGAAPALSAALRDNSGDWGLGELALRTDIPDILLEIATASDDGAGLLRDAVPSIVDVLLSETDEARCRGTIRVALRLAEILGTSTGLGRTELRTLRSLAAFLLTAGLQVDEYDRLLRGALLPAWNTVESIHHATWIADILDLVHTLPASSASACTTFVAAVLSSLSDWSSSFAPETATALEEAFGAHGVQLILRGRPTGVDDSQWAGLRGRNVLIYSLLDAPARRAEAWLREQEPTVQIYVCSEHHASRRTIDNARTADILVIVTSAATHAATGAIERARSTSSTVCYPLGTGWSGIVNAVRGALTESS